MSVTRTAKETQTNHGWSHSSTGNLSGKREPYASFFSAPYPSIGGKAMEKHPHSHRLIGVSRGVLTFCELFLEVPVLLVSVDSRRQSAMGNELSVFARSLGR